MQAKDSENDAAKKWESISEGWGEIASLGYPPAFSSAAYNHASRQLSPPTYFLLC